MFDVMDFFAIVAAYPFTIGIGVALSIAFLDSDFDKVLALRVAQETKIPFREVLKDISQPNYFLQLFSLIFLGGAFYYFWVYFAIWHLLLFPSLIFLGFYLSNKTFKKREVIKNHAAEVILRLLDKIAKYKAREPSNIDLAKLELIANCLIQQYELDKSLDSQSDA